MDLPDWDPISWLDDLRRVGKPKKKAKIMPSAYSKLKPDKKKAEALDLLHAVAKKGYGKLFLELANHGVPLEQKKGKGGRSAIHLVAENGHVQLMKDLLTKELPEIAEVLQDGQRFREKLQRAEQLRNLVTLKLGKYVKNKSKHGWRPLHFAVKACASQQGGEGGVAMVALLLLVQGDSGMLATQKRERVKKSGEETTKNKSGGESPVHIAAKYGTIRALELIWEWCDVFGKEGEKGGKFGPFTEPDEKGWTALHHAVATDQGEVVEWLLDRQRKDQAKLKVDATSEKGHTALMTAAEYSQNRMCKLLLQKGAKVDCAAADGLTALHLAAVHDNKELVELLLEHGASCKDQDEHGNTPLHIARKKYCLEADAALVDHDRTVLEVKNKEGYTPENIPPEDKEYIPPEIRKRGKEAIRVYEEALKDGRTQIPHVKFVLLGEAGHGKTSLLRLLEELEFVPKWKSTEGIECELVSSKTLDGTDEGSWNRDDGLTYPEALANIVVKNLPEPNTPAMRQRSHQDDLTEEDIKQLIGRLFHPPPPQGPMRHTGHPIQPLPLRAPARGAPAYELPSTLEPLDLHSPSSQPPISSAQRTQPPQPNPAVHRERTRQPQHQQREAPAREEGKTSLPQRPEEADPDPVSKQPEDIPARLLSDAGTGRAVRRAMPKVKDVEKLTFTTYDFAGQPLYRPMHHCFITQRSVFAIVFNAQEFIADEEACTKCISYWFNTVSAYTEKYTEKEGRQLENKPPVFLVGTHRGPYVAEDPRKSFEQISEPKRMHVIEVLKEHFEKRDKCCRYLPHITSRCYNFVENSQKGEESGAQALRSCLAKKAKSLPYMKEEYPVRWLRLETDLKSKEGLILLADVKEKARELNFPFDDASESCQELDEALRFFHEIGVITYPRSLPHIFLEGCDQEAHQLEEVILCGPKQLPNLMKRVVQFKEHSDKLSASERQDLTQKSVASEDALAVLFEEISSRSISDKKKALQCFCLLLRAYGLIVKMSTGRDEASHQPGSSKSPPGPQYLIPCLLEKMPSIPKPKRKCFSFVADFRGFLPQEVFMRFICLAALQAKHSILNRGMMDETEYHLTQDYCSVEGLAQPGDAWYISCDATNHKMEFQVSLPHDYKSVLMEFVRLASDLLDQLCKDLKLSGLLYQVGKESVCDSCGAERLIKLHESGRTVKEDEIKCSCGNPINPDDLLKQTITGIKRLREKPTEKELRKHICSAAIGNWKRVCTYLGIERQRVQCSLSNNHNDVAEAFFDNLVFWRNGNTDEPITWEWLLEALKEAEERQLAKDLKSKLLDGCL